jgi:hypothetical protein
MDEQFIYGFILGAVVALVATLGAIYGVHLDRMALIKKRRHDKQRLQFDPKRTFIQR